MNLRPLGKIEVYPGLLQLSGPLGKPRVLQGGSPSDAPNCIGTYRDVFLSFRMTFRWPVESWTSLSGGRHVPGRDVSNSPAPGPPTHLSAERVRFGHSLGVDRVEHAHADEGEAEVSNPGEQAVELGLILDRAGQEGRSVVLVGQIEIVDQDDQRGSGRSPRRNW